MTVFTAYRFTTAFMGTLNDNPHNLELYRVSKAMETPSLHVRAKAALKYLKDAGHIVEAATVTCELQDLFEVTNSINHNWIENDEVSDVNSLAFLSSTSVGDIFKLEDGSYMVTAGIGYTPIEL